MDGNPFKGVRGHNISIVAPEVTNVEGSKDGDDQDLTWLWVVVGVAAGACFCVMIARRLHVASAETRARYQVNVEPTPDEEEGVADEPKSFRSKGVRAQTPKVLRQEAPGTGLGSKTPKGPAVDGDKFNASGTFNFSFTDKSTTMKSNTGKQASQSAGARSNDSQQQARRGSKEAPKAKKEINEAEDALERSGVQVAQARTIGESLYRQMDERRNEPIHDRKRFFKELLLKWHPDKSSSEFAKDVVRFLQAQKDWFLKE
jgi:hypothetical protein